MLTTQLTRSQLIALVEQIIQGQGTLEELEAWLAVVEQNVRDPDVSGLIYWPSKYGLGDNPSAETIIDTALSYRPIQL